MKILKSFGNELSYKDILQLDGAFSVSHINYGKSVIFNETDSKEIAKKSRANSLSNEENIENVLEKICLFNGTEKNYNFEDRGMLWKSYWLEYINAFDNLVEILPNSIVTIFVGRQAIEIGLKYLLLQKTKEIKKEHNLGKLYNKLANEYDLNVDYMKGVGNFCEVFGEYIEGDCVEYFRYPEYKDNKYFAGNRLDISWISFNFVLILLKLIHLADIEEEL